MRKTVKIFIALMLTLGIYSSVQAQDKMILRGKKDTLNIKVIEVGTTEIRYRMWPVDNDMPVIVESRDRIAKIIFANGTVMKFSEDEFSNELNYATQRRVAVKWDMFAMTRKVLSVSGEYSLKPGVSTEIGLGYIGLGSYSGSDIYSFERAKGGFIRAGIKFINTPSYYVSGMRYSHILKGGYIRPELVFLANNTYNDNNSSVFYYTSHYETKVRGMAFMINFGKQWVFSDVACLDLFLGLGIGKKNVTTFDTNGNEVPYVYNDPTYTGGFTYFVVSETAGKTTFAFQAGLKIGGLLGAPKPKK